MQDKTHITIAKHHPSGDAPDGRSLAFTLAFILLMDIQNQILEFIEKHSLKERALNSIDLVMDASIEADKENGIDFLDGHNRTDLLYEFERFEFRVNKNGYCKIITKINIYSKKLYGKGLDIPVGSYEEWTDLEGRYLNKFLAFNWSPSSLRIDNYIEMLSTVVPQRYYKRNVPQYEFTTYVNHIIVLIKGRNFYASIIFIKRCLVYLEKAKNIEIEKEYLIKCLEMFQNIYLFIRNNNLIDEEKLSFHKIDERIKERKANIS
ncbi:hypothetical protein [Flammeovirga kamogawensis]|uniref:hypothetical protein n=1 Tax=Flammeovirga kamogawensis TaxID=373891 RepID=UPI001183E6EB|nr:hypothetical protein [Flammeovirga kamogawensis]MBB6464104.1 hypothetical protein [Flammeovirga kamogawensis]TRX65418.1 hypothetical protein EO216_23125 [Flammeovirga kamogawensis]